MDCICNAKQYKLAAQKQLQIKKEGLIGKGKREKEGKYISSLFSASGVISNGRCQKSGSGGEDKEGCKTFNRLPSAMQQLTLRVGGEIGQLRGVRGIGRGLIMDK